MYELSGRRVMLIGGAGFIGHNLALDLHRAGAQVSIVDGLQVNNLLAFQSASEASPNRQLYLRILHERLQLLEDAKIPLYVQDARDYHALSRLFAQIKPQTIVHLAAVSHAGKSNKDPYSTFDHSLRTLENALDASYQIAEHFVYFSSSMVYGDFPEGAVTEETPCSPIGIYGALKLSGELMVKAYQQVFKLPYTIVRPSALYGERCVSRRVGQIFIENAMQGLAISIAGDGAERLDFTYIDDLCAGLRQAITQEGARNETFNLTYGEARSVADMVAIMREEFPQLEVRNVARDALMPYRGTLNVDKARRLLHYEPAWPLDRGFPKYVSWYRRMMG